MSSINLREHRVQHREAMRRLGREARQMRLDSGRTQAWIAREAGISKGHLSAIEAGNAEASIEVLKRVATALGGDLGVRFFPGTGPRTRDHIQVAMGETLLAALHSRWRATPEVPVYKPVHGVIDLVLEDRAGTDTVAAEMHSQLRRIEQQVRWQRQKADGLGLQPDQEGRSISGLLVLRNTRAMREAVISASLTLRAAYPAPSVEAVAALTGEAAWPGAAIVWVTLERGVGRLLGGPPRGVDVGR